MDKLIRAGSFCSYDKIYDMFEWPEEISADEIMAAAKIPIGVYNISEEISYLVQALKIYYRELTEGVKVTVFDHGKSLRDIMDVINQIRLLLWERIFLKHDEALVTYLKNNEISPQMVSCLEEICVLDEHASAIESDYHKINKDTKRHAGKKIAFILCVNSDIYMNEALCFINNLEVPYGCEVEIFTIHDAKSMTDGYNEGMNASNAKYKVYLHQDVLIVNPYFIYDILDIFENSNVGMIGMVGSPCLSESKVMWYSKRIGKIYSANAYETSLCKFGEMSDEYESVEVVDGLLMATQYDIPWRADLFDKWDMYDMSQCIEFHRVGYDVVVPNMDAPWCLHDDGCMNWTNYDGELEKFKKEYYSN